LKNRQDPRHQKRITKFRQLFSFSFAGKVLEPESQVDEIISHLHEIDSMIEELAPEWPVARLNKVDLAILRLAIFELLITREVPPKVIVDEAVEISKEYGSESTPKFVNGVLGTLIEKKKLNEIEASS
jgi:N utilization substance protein B